MRKSAFKEVYLFASVKSGKIGVTQLPIDTKEILPKTMLKGNKRSRIDRRLDGVVPLKNATIYQISEFPEQTYSDMHSSEIEQRARYKDIIINKKADGEIQVVSCEKIDNNKRTIHFLQHFSHNKHQIFRFEDSLLLVYDSALALKNRIDFKSAIRKSYPEFSRVYGLFMKDDKYDQIYFISNMKPLNIFKVDVFNNKLTLVSRIMGDKDLSLTPKYVYDQHFYFSARPSATSYPAIFKMKIEQTSDTINIHGANTLAVSLYNKPIVFFSGIIPLKQTYSRLSEKIAKGLGSSINKRQYTPDSLKQLASMALEYLKLGSYDKFASELCSYSQFDFGRLSYYQQKEQLLGTPVFETDSQRELITILMQGIVDGTIKVDLEYCSTFIEAITADGWRFILIKDSNGLTFGSVFYKKVN